MLSSISVNKSAIQVHYPNHYTCIPVMFRRQTTALSVMSTHLEELPDQVVIPSSMIRLLDSIGEGKCIDMCITAVVIIPSFSYYVDR